MRPGIHSFLLLTLFAMGLSAQNDSVFWSPVQQISLPAGIDSVYLDSLPVLPSSIQFNRESSDVPRYELFQQPVAYLRFDKPLPYRLELSFRSIPLNINRTYFHKDTSLILPDFTTNLEDQLYDLGEEQSAFRPFQGLNSSGSISRGISVGNNQDAVLNSNLNLQLSGSIGPKTRIRASITDNSLPVQADGYTQTLREFDRVYIELENDDFGVVRAGDYNMVNPESYFMRFDKRISGAGIFTGVSTDAGEIPIELQGGLARGRFARNRFQAQEGNLGPYKLTGANGEQFIIIISGSERVYLNGKLLTRGQQNDYVIDYNAGEITFTTLQPITKESRIVIEFQYTEQNYLRSIFYGNTGFQSENQSTTISFYSEQDSKNQSLIRDLTDEEKQVLSQAGDNLSEAVVSTITPTQFADDLVLYELRDSLGFDSVLVASTDSTAALYQASFTFLGSNQGNYVLAQSDANGRVFRWAPPVGGVPQGSYEPVRQLIAPNQLQILNVRHSSKVGKNSFEADLAASKNDINLFSDLNKGNDVGIAGKLGYLRSQEFMDGEIQAGVNYEFNQDEFATIERIRRVEFARDWNLPLNYNAGVQLGGVRVAYVEDSLNLAYNADVLFIDQFTGFKNELDLRFRNSRRMGYLRGSLLNTSDSLQTSRFVRESFKLSQYLAKRWWVGGASIGEWNQRRQISTDSLNPASYNFFEYRLFSGFGDTATNFIEAFFMQRWDDTARAGDFVQFSMVNSYGLNSRLRSNFNSTLNASINIRDLQVFQPAKLPLARTITTRFNYIQKLFRNSIISNTFYETGAGTEPRRSFSYVQVPAGTGTHTHTDYNNNGIKELGEFEPAPTPDLATYVRVFTPSNEFLRTSIVRLSQTFNINAPGNWSGLDDFRSTLARFSGLFNFQLDQKSLLTERRNNINPFYQVEDDSLLVSRNNNLRSSIFFNRSRNQYGVSYTFRRTASNNLLSFGIEERTVQENSLDLRHQVFSFWLIKAQLAVFEKQNFSANFTGRNYMIDQLRNTYSLSYQAGAKLVLTGRYSWDRQISAGDNENTLIAQTTGFDLNYNLGSQFNAQLSASYINNNFEGVANSAVGFEMLKELRPGNNGTWSVILQRTLLKNILISINYSGRVSGDNRPIHTGNIEVKAFF